MPKRNMTPLTDEQAAYAAEHRKVIEYYLQDRKLPEGEFYDIAVFGYLRAVRRYLTVPELRQYQFSTIAKAAMRTEIGNHFRSLRAKKCYGAVVELDELRHGKNLEDEVAQGLESREEHRAVREILDACLTRAQTKIIQMKAQDYNIREIASACGLRCTEVERELEQARARVIQFAPELADMAA